ncbi:MAG TPA: hypothetical protein VG104_09810 [Candidatus Dormibacteraeota bacterium]|nr:hypothetical protein [Candidatus Dormibacteraeota bacterium]
MTNKDVHDIPIACMLSATDLADRRRAWHNLLDTAIVARERVPGGVRLTVNRDRASQLSALVDLERTCCEWITFALNGPSVTMTAHGDGEEVLSQMFHVI